MKQHKLPLRLVPGATEFRARMGQRIRVARQAMNYTQAQLAARSGISTNFVAHLERGTRSPSIETLNAIANVLTVPVADFFMTGKAGSAASPGRPLVRAIHRLLARMPDARLRLIAELLEAIDPRGPVLPPRYRRRS
ncbi:MAG: helix-turn-helix domain-containing protein [Candidatus Coatesbacteria bacterium]